MIAVIQLGKELMLEGIRVAYVPDARVESEIPATLSQVNVQQSRWEGGKREIYATLFPRILSRVLRKPSPMLLDGLLEMLVPPLSIVILLDLAGGTIAWLLGSGSIWELNVLGFVLAVVAAVLLIGVAEGASGRSRSRL